jgi:predicted anti-sigma-YlaC factor YlaD
MKDHPSQWIASGLTCHDVCEGASEYLDDRLPLMRKVRMGLHLASCDGCRTYVRQFALITETIRALPKAYPSPINRLKLRQAFSARLCQSASAS